MEGGDVGSRTILIAVLFYMLCSSVMLVANKVAVTLVPLPGLMVCCQFVVAVAFVAGRSIIASIETDSFTFERVVMFLPYVASMSLCIFSNVKSLHFSNVETVICFRACTPICVSLLDWFFLGRELPGFQSLASLLMVFFGAVGYVMTDSEFKMNGFSAYTWVTIYFFAIVGEMTYGKRVMSKIKFSSPVWGSLLYTNVLCIPPMFVMAVWNSEPQQVSETEISLYGAAAVFFTCVVGVCISYAGWNCREKTSATSFTLIGVACKFLSVLINIFIWDKHASSTGIACLFVCIGASALYRQSPMRPEEKIAKAVPLEEPIGSSIVIEDGSSIGGDPLEVAAVGDDGAC